MAKPVEFRYVKKHYVHDDKVLKTISVLQTKNTDYNFWADVKSEDQIIKLPKKEDLEYYINDYI